MAIFAVMKKINSIPNDAAVSAEVSQKRVSGFPAGLVWQHYTDLLMLTEFSPKKHDWYHHGHGIRAAHTGCKTLHD
ncbi:MAG: hypothetical protein LAT75_04465 [Candidatus Cyclonatronum sp.]|uniref:hypothetical protein n=1 Tax=Cyclonatronum sp. TaxID=3024185 RepID=UPI0025BCC71F|nr:hypothetical protein [Cyclonatronum sp.]MCH8486094.1 hypothetical protein [Cyclonatronum sp.]